MNQQGSVAVDHLTGGLHICQREGTRKAVSKGPGSALPVTLQ